jgi:hypothetical protein
MNYMIREFERKYVKWVRKNRTIIGIRTYREDNTDVHVLISYAKHKNHFYATTV